MTDSMQLNATQEKLLNKHLHKIKAETMRQFGHRSDIDDLYQVMLINYCVALKKADLSENFHSYCIQLGKWACIREINKSKYFSQHHMFIEEFEENLDYDSKYLHSVNDTLEQDLAMTDAVKKIVKLHSQLTPQDMLVVNHSILGDTKRCTTIKLRRQQMIAKQFKDSVKELLNVA